MTSAYWSAIWFQIFLLTTCYELKYPKNFTSLSDDLKIQLYNISWPIISNNNQSDNDAMSNSEEFTVIELLTSQNNNNKARAYTKVRISPTTTSSIPTAIFPCNLFWHGGRYWLRYNDATSLQALDVRWYNVSLNLDPNIPKVIQTFQENINVYIKFHDLACISSSSSVSANSASHLQLQLVFCGHSEEGCRPGTDRVQILHSEEIWPGYEKLHVTLGCQLFGQAGRYLIWLVGTSIDNGNGDNYLLAESQVLHAEWSEQFVFNVNAGSIFPCDTLPSAQTAGGGSKGEHGITVLFTYPQCILPDADRVRVFARKEPLLSSVVQTKLIYVSEQRVMKGKHSVTFPCALFTETYVEYCFKYVSGARSGAASDVRMNCIPTLPLGESEAGAWGSWSAWSACTTTCGGSGFRNRYRFCDSPPPRYGAKFCEGKLTESEPCPEQTMCPDGSWSESGPGAALPADSEVVQAEVGPGCHCGCVMHLGKAKPKRLLAMSSQTCPRRTFWLVQAEDERHVIELSVNYFRLPCKGQWLKIRDGESIASTLIAHLTTESHNRIKVQSKTAHLHIEFDSGSEQDTALDCRSGFLAYAQQVEATDNVTISAILPNNDDENDDGIQIAAITLTAVHIAALSFVALILLLSIALGAQYTYKYRKYQRAAAIEPNSPSHSFHGSTCSTTVGSLARFTSSTTISEIISLRRFSVARRLRPKHERLIDSKLEPNITSVVITNDGEIRPTLAEDDDFDEEDEVSSSTEETQQDIELTPVLPKKHLPKPSPTALRRSLNFSPQRTEKRKKPKHKAAKQKLKHKNESSSEASLGGSIIGKRIANSVVPPTLPDSEINKPEEQTTTTPTPTPKTPKASKEQENRAKCLKLQENKKGRLSRSNHPMHQRILQAGSSEFSLAGTESEMEMDYYDYNVHNASAAPGSYLGMDPAYLIWIPPSSPSDIDEQRDSEFIEETKKCEEKETHVEKIITDEDIKFADEDEDEGDDDIIITPTETKA